MVDPIASLLGSWASELNVFSVILRIAFSLLLSAYLGFERSTKRHAAGLRTFMVVSLATTISMLLDIYLLNSAKSGLYLISAASIVSVAIITVNSILYSSRSQIKGLTTSVALWASAVLGLCIGAGFYTVTLVSYLAFICTLSVFPRLERYFKNRSNHFEVHLELKNIAYLQNFVTTIRELGMKIDDIEMNTAYQHSGLSVYSISISISSQELKKYKTHSQIIEALRSLDYIYHIEEMV